MANRQSYTSQKRHTRVLYPPLTYGCQLECLTPDSPVTQVSSSLSLQYVPDRTISPTSIRPTLCISDPADIIGGDVCNALLASSSHAWYVDGEEISSVWTEGTDYEVTSSSDEYNGTIKIYKNILVDAGVTLMYKGIFCDTRTGFNQEVTSDTIALNTVDGGMDEMDVVVSQKELVWNPIEDNLYLYEYLTGNGIATDLTEDTAYDGHQYRRSVTVTLTRGGTVLEEVPDGYSLKLVSRTEVTDSDGEVFLSEGEEITSDMLWVDEWDGTTLTLDMRCMYDLQIEAQLIYDDTGAVLSRKQIDFQYAMSQVSHQGVKNHCDIATGQETWSNEAIVNTRDKYVEYPELYYNITWYLQQRVLNSAGTAYETSDETELATGATVSVDESALGMGDTYDNNWCVTKYTLEERPVYVAVTDDDGNYLVDDDGNILIA